MLIGADPIGIEVLKNLVLAGVSKIAIVDNQMVSKIDLNSFFIDALEFSQQENKS